MKISRANFFYILNEIEVMEVNEENIWLPIGLLELLVEDNIGFIDHYFHSPQKFRDREELWNNIC